MRNLITEEKALKLLLNNSEDDILIALELFRDLKFEDVPYLRNATKSSSWDQGIEMYYIDKYPNHYKPGKSTYRINDIEIDIWTSMVFFAKR